VADLTCDSDGRVDAFVGAANKGVEDVFSDAERGAPSPFLTLHAPREGEPYLMAAFLVGAYQESMGSAGHNLFGSPATANVFLETERRKKDLQKTKPTHDSARVSFSFRLDSVRGGVDDVVVSLRAGDTNADALRGAGVDTESIVAWVRGGGGDTSIDEANDAALLAAVDDVLRESTYLESRDERRAR
jgi:arginine decarboxylase